MNNNFKKIIEYAFVFSHLSHGSGKSGRFRAQVVFLDDTYHIFDLDKKAKGSALIEVSLAILIIISICYLI